MQHDWLGHDWSPVAVQVADFSDLDATAEQFWCTLFRFMLGSCKNVQDVSTCFALCVTLYAMTAFKLSYA
jgi:hypothetical protein